MKSSLSLFLKGLAMGAANVIPGVSGGTLALITGIYETLINAVKSFDLAALRLLFQGQFKAFWQHINGNFLLAVFAGIGVSIITLAKMFKFLLEHETYATWLMAFFFGLILVSIYSVGRTLERWSAGPVLALIIGFGFALALALLSPAGENSSLVYLLLCGVVAMCSMILPGLSGSFVLIIMGNYKLIMLDAVSEFKLNILIPVVIGAGIGLLVFSRLLAWVFKYYRDLTIALMTGFILGSLAIIWPWKEAVFLVNEQGEQVLKNDQPIISGYEWFLPGLSDPNNLIALLMILIGGITLWAIERVGMQKTA